MTDPKLQAAAQALAKAWVEHRASSNAGRQACDFHCSERILAALTPDGRQAVHEATRPEEGPCPACDGQGWVVATEAEMACCRRFLGSGECCGNPVQEPVQVQDGCGACGGTGHVPTPADDLATVVRAAQGVLDLYDRMDGWPKGTSPWPEIDALRAALRAVQL